MLIGLSGYARSGKDTVGAYMVDEWGFTRHAFADTMKAAAEALNPIVDFYGPTPFQVRPVYLKEVLESTGGWEGAKAIPEVRRLLQRLGTEVGRNLFGSNFWVERTFDNICANDHVVITDVRFVNEAQAVIDHGGIVVRVSRPDVGAPNDHISEHALADWKFDDFIANTGTITDLRQRVSDLLCFHGVDGSLAVAQ